MLRISTRSSGGEGAEDAIQSFRLKRYTFHRESDSFNLCNQRMFFSMFIAKYTFATGHFWPQQQIHSTFA